MRTNGRTARVVAAVAVSAAVLAGCASSGVARRESVVSQTEQAKSYVDRSKEQIAVTLAALNDLQGKSGDVLRSRYQKFVQEYNKTESLANDSARQAMEVQAKGEQQLKAWQAEAATIQDPELRKKAADRRAEQAQRYRQFATDMSETNRTLQAFLVDLRDIKTYLDLDLSTRGVEAVRDKIDRANADSSQVVQSLDHLNQRLDAVSISLQPGKEISSFPQ